MSLCFRADNSGVAGGRGYVPSIEAEREREKGRENRARRKETGYVVDGRIRKKRVG